MRLLIVALFLLTTASAFAASPSLTPEQKRELDRVHALRGPQEKLFAQALLAHPDLAMSCRLPNSEESVDVPAGELATHAIGARGPIEWMRNASAEDLLVARIHSQNDSISAQIADAFLRALTFGLMDNQTIYTIRAGGMDVTADFRYGSLELHSIHCYVRAQ